MSCGERRFEPKKLPESSYFELLLWLLRRRRRFQVTGVSMVPLLQPGHEVLVDCAAYERKPPCVGDIIVAQHPKQQDLRLIKRVTQVLPDGSCLLVGENLSQSTDSRAFGAIAPHYILGRVTSQLP